MRWTPHTTVATVIQRDDRFLFVEEKIDGQLVLNQPAGHLEENETLVEAAARECLEETGWTVEIAFYMGIYVYRAPSNGITYHRHCFGAKTIHHDPLYTLDDGIVGTKWLTIPKLISSRAARSPLVVKCAQDFLTKPHYSLDIIYEHTHNDSNQP